MEPRTTSVPARSLRVAAVQMQSLAGDKHANLARIETFVAQAAEQGVKLVIFPECCVTGYWFLCNLSAHQLAELAEGLDGASVERLLGLARQYDVTIGAGFVERGATQAYHNSYVVVLPDGKTHCHRKLHAFEHPLIQSGTKYTVFDTPYGWRVGVLICYDNNVIENGRITALLGADIILAPHQTGGCRTRNSHLMGAIERELWENRHTNPAAIEQEFRGEKGRGWLLRWLPSRAHDNGVFVVFANGVGVDDDEIRTGNAMILDPYGRILTETWAAADAMVVADLDARLLQQATGRSWIAARRPELYGLLAQPTGRERDTRELKFEE
jgi:predicted amidohydrolase